VSLKLKGHLLIFRLYVSLLPQSKDSKKRKPEKALGPKDHKFYNIITRGEASLSIRIHIEKLGFNAFLAMRRVPGYILAC
jgi:hypothetical protein